MCPIPKHKYSRSFLISLVKKHMTQAAIARELEISRERVRQLFKIYNVPYSKKKQAKKFYYESGVKFRENQVRQLANQHYLPKEISEKLCLSETTIKKYLKRFKIPCQFKTDKLKERDKKIVEEYKSKKKVKDIANDFSICIQTIQRVVRKYYNDERKFSRGERRRTGDFFNGED